MASIIGGPSEHNDAKFSLEWIGIVILFYWLRIFGNDLARRASGRAPGDNPRHGNQMA
ncbi:hypothetical protein Rmet_6413 [Cupriavidus metallidurans CH34]|uniref:Uncharacterized protein n=1 Tax=Cupriavidus metallidurans (strain ATCC 43123 / DSM 2839 / NBRC 102507 / CH34) TaxID=266264 RepID=D3DXL1_CUPMC|nr:hypothetical protein Rmet_6413 [Cupriavidus metallidurans CH34]